METAISVKPSDAAFLKLTDLLMEVMKSERIASIDLNARQYDDALQPFALNWKLKMIGPNSQYPRRQRRKKR